MVGCSSNGKYKGYYESKDRPFSYELLDNKKCIINGIDAIPCVYEINGNNITIQPQSQYDSKARLGRFNELNDQIILEIEGDRLFKTQKPVKK